jgi:hypothetical protein
MPAVTTAVEAVAPGMSSILPLLHEVAEFRTSAQCRREVLTAVE